MSLRLDVARPAPDADLEEYLTAKGLIEPVTQGASRAVLQQRYRRNPLEHVRTVIVEYTTRCNFACAHCYAGRSPRVTEDQPHRLTTALDVFLRMGVREVAFIGGEVSRFGEGWLTVARHARAGGAQLVALLSNGWWLEQRGFVAAGRRYAEEADYLSDLKTNGVTHVAFSIDGWGVAHDESRDHLGLFARILNGIDVVRAAGLEPRVAILARPQSGYDLELMACLADRIHGPDATATVDEKAARLVADSGNLISNFVDYGNAATRGRGPVGLWELPRAKLRCMAFYRPAPSLTLRANGEVATCRLAEAGEGYGNFHHRPLVDILNGMHEAFVYRLHAENAIADYRRFVDTDVFGDRFNHVCALRAILTLLARGIQERQIDRQTAEHCDN